MTQLLKVTTHLLPKGKTPLQAQEMGGRRFKREEVIANIKAMYDPDATPNLSTNHSDLMEINNRYIYSSHHILMLSLLTLN